MAASFDCLTAGVVAVIKLSENLGRIGACHPLQYYRAITLTFGNIRLTPSCYRLSNAPQHRVDLGNVGLGYPADAADQPAQVALDLGLYLPNPRAAVFELAAG